jgi:hypothetical protein
LYDFVIFAGKEVATSFDIVGLGFVARPMLLNIHYQRIIGMADPPSPRLRRAGERPWHPDLADFSYIPHQDVGLCFANPTYEFFGNEEGGARPPFLI